MPPRGHARPRRARPGTWPRYPVARRPERSRRGRDRSRPGNTISRTVIPAPLTRLRPLERKGERPVPLDPQIQAMRDQRERDNVPPLYAMSLAGARAADLASIQETGGEPEPVYEVADLKITGP